MSARYQPRVTEQVTVLHSLSLPHVEVPVRRLLPILVVLFSCASLAHAQESSAGVSYTVLALDYPDETPGGFGVWFTRDLTSRPGPTIGLDLGLNFFPEDDPIIGRQTQVFGGIRGGLRYQWFGVYGRLRPGVMRFSRQFFAPDTVCVLIFPPPDSCLTRENNLAFDLGGTLELYPIDRAIVRVDLGDTAIRFRRVERDSAWRRNLQFSAGAGIRF